MSDYGGLINVEEIWDKREYFIQERWDVSFFCKDCSKIVDTKRPKPNGYTFICETCWSDKVSIWTEESLKTRYKIK